MIRIHSALPPSAHILCLVRPPLASPTVHPPTP